MADAPAKTTGRMGFLSRKLGPIPVWGWGLIGFGVYWWYTHYGPGAKPAAAAPAASRPQVVIVNPREPRQPPQRQDGQRPPSRRPPRRKPPVPRRVAPAVAPSPAAAPGGQPGQVATPQSPVYDEWTADAGGVPDPQQAYAPMTAGSIYG